VGGVAQDVSPEFKPQYHKKKKKTKHNFSHPGEGKKLVVSVCESWLKGKVRIKGASLEVGIKCA
jgi:hypothetical protein